MVVEVIYDITDPIYYHQFFIFLISTFFPLKRCSINKEIINSKKIKSFMEKIFSSLFFCSFLNAIFFIIFFLLPSALQHSRRRNIYQFLTILYHHHHHQQQKLREREEAQIENQITDNLKRLSSRKFIKSIHQKFVIKFNILERFYRCLLYIHTFFPHSLIALAPQEEKNPLNFLVQ